MMMTRCTLGLMLATLIMVDLPAPLHADARGTAPLICLSFDRAANDGITDESGNGFDGVAHGKVEPVDGKVGKALKFDGSSDVTIADSPRLDLTGSITIMLWVNPEGVGSPRLVDKTTVGKNDGYLVDLHPGNHVRMIIAPGTLNSTEALPPGQWTHLAAVHDGEEGVQSIYVNGRLDSEQALAPGGRLQPNDNPLRLGVDSQGGSRFKGLMDEVRIYDRALSPREIAEDAGVKYVPTAEETPTTFLKGMSQDVDYASLLSRNDLVYLAPALHPHEAMPLGNGNLCALLWNRDGLNLQLNNGEYWRGYCQVSSGRVTLRTTPSFVESPKSFEQRLSLWDGCVRTRVETGEGTVQMTSFAAEGSDVVAVHVRDDRRSPAAVEVDLHLWNVNGMDRKDAQFHLASDLIAITETSKHEQDTWVDRTMVNALTIDGSGFTTEKVNDRTLRLKLTGAKEYTLFIAAPAVSPSADGLAVARDALSTLKKKGWQRLLEERQTWWHNFWLKSYVHLSSSQGDADYMENLWYLNFYWLASQSRGTYCPKFNGGTFLPNYDWRGWGGSYWYQNTRELFWPTLAANHPELCKPFHDLYSRVLPKAKEHARNLFNKDGAQYQETMVLNGEGDKAGNPYTFLYLTTGLECSYEFYRWYEFTQDEAFLREKAYPMLKECVAFYLDSMTKGSDGYYHIYPTDSRETYWRVQDAHTDLAALRAVLPVLVRESARLKLDADLRQRWQDLSDHLAPYPLDAERKMYAPCTFLKEPPKTDNSYVEKLYPPERTSHSWSERFNSENTECDLLYPWGGAGIGTENHDLAKATYLQRTFRSSGGWDPAAIWAARLGLAEEAGRVLLEHARNSQVWTQGFWNSPASVYWGGILYDAPYFDPPGVSATAMNEMMLQSYTDIIRVFPAWPRRWQGAFRLRARTGFMIASEVRNGRIPYVLVESLRGGECRLANPWQGETALTDASGKSRKLTGQTLSFPTTKGQTYRLIPVVGSDEQPEVRRLAPKPNVGPKWPGPNDAKHTMDDYLKTRATNFLGITADGRTPLRLRVQDEASRRHAELEKIIGGRVNLATRARAFVSAPNQPDRDAPGLTDGLFGEENQVEGDVGCSFTVDLGEPRPVAALLWSRDRKCELNFNWITAYEIEVSADGKDWKSVAQVNKNKDGWGRTDSFDPVTTRFVRLRVLQSSYQPIVDEMEVYGP